MAWTLLNDLSTDGASVFVAGTTLPVPCIVEDAESVRLLVLPPGIEAIPASLWVRAHSTGVGLLVCVEDENVYSVLPTEEFLETREDRAREGTMVPTGWWGWQADTPPTFREILEALVRERQIEQSREGADPELGDGEPSSGDPFVSLHSHTEYSPLDGCSTVKELVDAAVAAGHRALAVTDHQLVTGHPDLKEECARAGIKPIYGLEANFVPDRHRRGETRTEVVDGKEVKLSDAKEALGEYTHMCLWAMNNAGLRNIWAISTEGYVSGFYGKARIDWDVLERHNEGVLASSGCLGGPIATALKAGDEDRARQLLGRFMQLFPDRYYIELHTNHLEEQILVNKQLVELAREFGLPMIAAVDHHYTYYDEVDRHRAWLAVQTNKDLTEDTGMFGGGQRYHYHTTPEVAEALAYLGEDVVAEAIANTGRLADRCDAQIERNLRKPVFSRGEDAVARDVERLTQMCMENWGRKVVGKKDSQEDYAARFETEMELLIGRELCGFYLVTADIVRWAKKNGILVGPCRGSSGASLVAYLADIIEVDPVAAKLPFERFLTWERDEMPDFDLDFPSSKVSMVHGYARQRWGDDHVIRLGTHSRERVKSSVNDARRVLAPTLGYEPDFQVFQRFGQIVDSYAETLSGAQPKWNNVWRLYAEELAPIRAAAPEVFDLAEWICGRLKTYGTHPAGLAISTDEPLSHLPLRVDKNGVTVSQFDYRQMDVLGYLKYDFLVLATLDVLQDTVDMVEQRYGRRIDVYGWEKEYEDPQVWDTLSAGHTLGVFQIGTRSGRRLTRQIQPRSITDLAAIMALGRPGPLESKLTEIYLKRRSGQELVSYVDPRLEEVLGETLGCVVYQEQVMGAAVLLAGYTLGEADSKVRKILGKKLVDKVAEAGQEFLARAVECGTDREVAEQLWAQLAEFARYSFGRAHSWGYAILAHWTAWFKVHFPQEFLAATLTTVKVERIPEFIDEARRLGFQVLPPDVNESKLVFTPTELAVRFGLEGIKGLGEKSVPQIIAGQPYSSYKDFVTRVVEAPNSKVNKGHLATLVRVGALDSLVPNRRALEAALEYEASGEATRCVHKDPSVCGPGGLPCTYDWVNEPDPPTKFVGRGKAKLEIVLPPPAKCTVKCRQYRPPAPLDLAEIPPYTADDIRTIERTTFGVWLSSLPFDRVPADQLLAADSAADVEMGEAGEYLVVAVIGKVDRRTTRYGKPMARVDLVTPDGVLDAVAWDDVLSKYGPDLRPDALVAVPVLKKARNGNWSYQIAGVAPL